MTLPTPYWIYEHHTRQAIQKLHDQAVEAARELGKEYALEGRDNRSPLDICDTLDNAFSDGWGSAAEDGGMRP